MNSIITNIRTRLSELRREENGFTMIEMVVVVATLGLLTVGFIAPIMTATETEQAMRNDVLGINQGTVPETAQDVFEAAVAYKQSNPDEPLTKEAMIADGFNLPSTFVWNVGEHVSHQGLDSEICSIVYSTIEQTDEFTIENPAEYNKDYEHDAARTYACWTYDEVEGEHVPNWGI